MGGLDCDPSLRRACSPVNLFPQCCAVIVWGTHLLPEVPQIMAVIMTWLEEINYFCLSILFFLKNMEPLLFVSMGEDAARNAEALLFVNMGDNALLAKNVEALLFASMGDNCCKSAEPVRVLAP